MSPRERAIPVSNEIEMFFHCGQCMAEYRADFADRMTPREYGSVEVGWTRLGLQVWCTRHELNVIHIDFLGQKVGANTGMEAE
jgi:hypothetical protein